MHHKKYNWIGGIRLEDFLSSPFSDWDIVKSNVTLSLYDAIDAEDHESIDAIKRKLMTAVTGESIQVLVATPETEVRRIGFVTEEVRVKRFLVFERNGPDASARDTVKLAIVNELTFHEMRRAFEQGCEVPADEFADAGAGRPSLS